MKYRPRNDIVLIHRIDKGQVRGVAMPDMAAEGKELQVEACGPDVEDLQPGDVVLAIGTPGQDLIRLPGEHALFATKQQNVLMVIEKEKAEK